MAQIYANWYERMEELIRISNLNDFLFCPASIYFHSLMDGSDRTLYQSEYQINGTWSHTTIDNGTYSSKKSILQGIEIYSEQYGLTGKIDIFDVRTETLTERKKHITKIYDGHVLQIYGQYFGLIEAGYSVKKLRIHSMDNNKNYDIPLPSESPDYLKLFKNTITLMNSFDLSNFTQTNAAKCDRCIYAPMCPYSEIP